MLKIGSFLARRYEIIRKIGSGGMADVYKARDRKLNRYVAIKVLRREYYDDETLVKRFTAEAESAAMLTHPNIVSVYDAGYYDGIYYIVMELAEGMTLKSYIRRYGRLSARETVDFATQIARGLEAAHNRQIVHRDIKPQNILVSDNGDLKITDFGIARVASGDTISPESMGSVHYLSPEQAKGGYTDRRSDIYSLGITIYEMATGRVPFDSDNSFAIPIMHLKEEIIPPRNYFPDIPASLEKIILKCTMKKPEQRYQNAADLIADLQRVFSSPDGNYIYLDTQVDDSPTIKRSREEMERLERELRRSRRIENRKRQMEEEPGEDEEDNDDTAGRVTDILRIVTIILGVAIAGLAIFAIGTSLNLFSAFGTETTTEGATEAISTEQTEEAGVKMPKVIGMTRDKAKEKLESLGLKAKFTYEKGYSAADSGIVVIKQDKPSGTMLEEGTTVGLTLGVKQTEKVEVPALINMSSDEAEQKLKDVGLKVKKAYASSDTVEKDYVIEQSPKGGMMVDKGFTVTITICTGAGNCRVPSLYGLSQKAAERELKNVGLELGDVGSDYSGDVGVGDVISQSITAGTTVEKGTRVSIVVSLGEQATYRYEGDVTVDEQPFGEGESGTVTMELKQGSNRKTIFSQSNISNDDFPLSVNFEGFRDGAGTVIVKVNGSNYSSYDVELRAIAD
ncbi:MAG: Stk1 family PASTA domain-containing Ser/Thr kinase [Eubacterium sp.]|nr:Stk1 family PASTA domain-containing Ser/Thr kinase [Eubacterium sp.]